MEEDAVQRKKCLVTTVDGYLHKTVPLSGNTCQLKPDITEHDSTPQYVTLEVADLLEAIGWECRDVLHRRLTPTHGHKLSFIAYTNRRTRLDGYTRYLHTSCDEGNTNLFLLVQLCYRVRAKSNIKHVKHKSVYWRALCNATCFDPQGIIIKQFIQTI